MGRLGPDMFEGLGLGQALMARVMNTPMDFVFSENDKILHRKYDAENK